MSIARAARKFRRSLSPPGRWRAATTLVVGTLVCCAWFGGILPVRASEPAGTPWQPNRSEAVEELARARQRVDEGRAATAAARARLDAFLTRHFDKQQAEDPPRPALPGEPNHAIQPSSNSELDRCQRQRDELVVHRQMLLGYLTPEHPQVAYVDEQIAAVEGQIAILSRVSFPSDGPAPEQISAAEKQWAEYVESLDRRREQEAAEYRQLFEAWQSASSALEIAESAEIAAAEQLDALTTPTPQITESDAVPSFDDPTSSLADEAPQLTPAGEPRDTTSVATATAPPPSSSSGSQSLALAALMIALAVAALTAVRLARSSADPVFSNVDEVAAALAIPVVGIIPATAARIQRARPAAGSRRQWTKLARQIIVAVLVFSVVAYGVQNPGNLWELCTHPLEALNSMLQAIRGS